MNPWSILAFVFSCFALGISIFGSRASPPEQKLAVIEGGKPENDFVTDGAPMWLEARIRRLETQMHFLARAGRVSEGAPSREARASRRSSLAAEQFPADLHTEQLWEELQANLHSRTQIAAFVVGEIQKFEKEKWEERRTRFAVAQEYRLHVLAESTNLTVQQKERLGPILSAEREELGALLERARSDMNWRQTRRGMRALRSRTDENVSAL